MDPLILRLLLSAKQQDVAALRQLHILIELVSLIGDLVHQLQRERGLSNIAIYLPQSLLQLQLQQQTGLVDRSLAQTTEIIDRMMSSGHLYAARLQTSIALGLQSSHGLLEIRKSVERYQSSQDISQTPCEQYSEIIRLWLDVVIEAAGLSVSAPVTQSVLSLIYLLQAKEFAGQERAWGVIAFSGKAHGVALTERLQVLGQSQQDVLATLWLGLGAEISAPFQCQFNHDADLQYHDLKKLMFGLCLHSQASPALAELWFECASRRIDVLHDLLGPVNTALEQQLVRSKQQYDKEKTNLNQHQLGPATQISTVPVSPARVSTPPALFKHPDQASLIHLLHEQSQYISNIEMELEHARAAVQELKVIQRAKLILIEQHKLTEPQAHHQLQKLAMDRQQSLADIATQVVQMMSHTHKKSAKST